MPSKDEHLLKAKRNEQVAGALSKDFRDWQVTAIFYAALHYLEMHLAVEGHHPPSHEKRDPLIIKHRLLQNVWSPYKRLNVLSRNARYYAYTIVDADVNNAKTWLAKIKEYLQSIGHKL